ncbi:hypothetical protein GIX45_21660 [Erwinia sp. CPCC 100877]|nr:hypothetical protein [Erwinia sp. CPCC 100877]
MKVVRAFPFEEYHFNEVHFNFIDRFFINLKYKKPGLNRSMFNEDFARIFCSGSRRTGHLFSIESNDNQLEQKLFGNIKTRHSPYRIDEKICELVEDVAQLLIEFGDAYYFVYDNIEKQEIYITPFRAIGVFRFFNVYCQLVPQRCLKNGNSEVREYPRELRILDRTKVMCFSMPNSIKRMLSEQNRFLSVLDKHLFDGTDFYPKATHENPNPKNDFDFRVWNDTQERALYRATRETGWNGRKYDSSKRSDFFVCHRLIRFRRNQLILRDHILKLLGNEFTRVGRQYNAEFHVTILPTDVLPKIDKLDDLEARLLKEEATFSEILDFCYGR